MESTLDRCCVQVTPSGLVHTPGLPTATISPPPTEPVPANPPALLAPQVNDIILPGSAPPEPNWRPPLPLPPWFAGLPPVPPPPVALNTPPAPVPGLAASDPPLPRLAEGRPWGSSLEQAVTRHIENSATDFMLETDPILPKGGRTTMLLGAAPSNATPGAWVKILNSGKLVVSLENKSGADSRVVVGSSRRASSQSGYRAPDDARLSHARRPW